MEISRAMKNLQETFHALRRRLERFIGRTTRTVYTFFIVWGHRWRDGTRSDLKEAALSAKGIWNDKGPQGKACQFCKAKDTVIKMDGGLFCLNCGNRPPNSVLDRTPSK